MRYAIYATYNIKNLGVDERNHKFKVYTPDSDDSRFRKYFSFSEQQVTDYFNHHEIVAHFRGPCKQWFEIYLFLKHKIQIHSDRLH